jgi:hypothetical protein
VHLQDVAAERHPFQDCQPIRPSSPPFGSRQRAGGAGTVFRLTVVPISPPKLTTIHSGPNVILSWPTNATGFVLPSATNLDSSSVCSTSLPPPVIVNDQNVVTNPVTGTQMFFRLSQ